MAHGVVEGQAEDLDKEVDGVAGEVVLGPASAWLRRGRPAPVAVLEDEAGIGGQNEIARLD